MFWGVGRLADGVPQEVGTDEVERARLGLPAPPRNHLPGVPNLIVALDTALAVLVLVPAFLTGIRE